MRKTAASAPWLSERRTSFEPHFGHESWADELSLAACKLHQIPMANN
jgi:hypothetical protein